MGLDGIAVDKLMSDHTLNIEALAAEYLSTVKKLIEANLEHRVGQIEELNVITDSIVAVVMAITKEYFLVLALPPNGNFGLARYQLRKCVLRLVGELS